LFAHLFGSALEPLNLSFWILSFHGLFFARLFGFGLSPFTQKAREQGGQRE
jgi:hypothetical protein